MDRRVQRSTVARIQYPTFENSETTNGEGEREGRHDGDVEEGESSLMSGEEQGSPGEVEGVLSPIQLNRRRCVGFARSAGESGVVGGRQSVDCVAHRSVEHGPHDGEGEARRIALGLSRMSERGERRCD